VTRETTKFENRPSVLLNDACNPNDFNRLQANSITASNNGILRPEQRIFALAGCENSVDIGKINEKSAIP
jgi:hypothetical protein